MAIIARKKQLTYRDSTLGPDGPELQGGGPDVVVVVHGLLRSPGTGSRVVRLPANYLQTDSDNSKAMYKRLASELCVVKQQSTPSSSTTTNKGCTKKTLHFEKSKVSFEREPFVTKGSNSQGLMYS